jgi:hypothetical protein
MHRNGKAPHDVGPLSNGLGIASLDVGTSTQDVGVTPQSLGVTPQDGGLAPQGAGMTPPDAGLTPQHAGLTPQSLALPMQPPSTPARHRRVAFSSNASIAQRLATAQSAIDTILAVPDLQTLMAAHGYDPDRMRQGRELYEQALALCQRQHAQYGDLYAATDARGAAHAQAHAAYIRHFKLAKVALRDNRGAAQKIGLAAQRARTLAGWQMQAQQFYANTLADATIVGALAQYGVTQAQLAAGQQQVDLVMTSTVTQQMQKGTAQATTQARDVALVALNHWMRDFLAIARIALADYPQQLRQLGLGVSA